MSAPTKTPSKRAGWGSLLSGAVAGLESRLDNMLADDSPEIAREQASEQSHTDKVPGRLMASNPKTALVANPVEGEETGSREASRTRGNERLAERLAKATASKNAGLVGSAVPSRVASPVVPDSSRASTESKRSIEAVKSSTETPSISAGPNNHTENVVQSGKASQNAFAEDHENAEDPTLLTSGLPINPAKVSMESSRPSTEVSAGYTSSRPSSEFQNQSPQLFQSVAEVEAEMSRRETERIETEKQRQEEMQTLLEKVDALQSKLQYLAKETVASAREANAASGSDAAKLAEKDEKIALLMEEGEKLSKTELRHLQTIKKLRAKGIEDNRASVETQKRLEHVERSEAELKTKVRRAEVLERQGNEKLKQAAANEKQLEELRLDRKKANELVESLKVQLKEAKEKAERAENLAGSKARVIDKDKIASLENELEDAQIEKRLAEDKAAAEIKKVREQSESSQQRYILQEVELKNEVASLESRLEVMRSRAEEVSAEGAGGGESNVKLLRQVETLQNQYSVAKENWETIEGSLNSRLAGTEKERDEAVKREVETRRKARDAGGKSRKTEDELERVNQQVHSLNAELESRKADIGFLSVKLTEAESATADVRAELEKQRKVSEMELAHRIEVEKGKPQPSPPWKGSPKTNGRKASPMDIYSLHSTRRHGRLTSDLSAAQVINDRSSSYRNSTHAAMPASRPRHHSLTASMNETQTDSLPSMSRQNSSSSMLHPSAPPTLSMENEMDNHVDLPATPASTSPERTIADLVSHSTATNAAGPSVQLVERMSAAVRRLESEKASFKDELARLTTQRDSARDEVVGLMREAEAKRDSDRRIVVVEKDLQELEGRYEGALELLGEREEQVEELKGDVMELKRIYRELVEKKVGSAT